MMLEISELCSFNKIIAEKKIAVIYYFNEQCSVCNLIKPQVENMMANKFPHLESYQIDCKHNPDISAQNLIFSIPQISVYYNNIKYISINRFINIKKLQTEIEVLEQSIG